MNRFKYLSAAIALAVGTSSANAALSVNSSTYTYTQNFDSLSSAPVGTPLAWANDSTLEGWSLFNKDLNAISTYIAGTGSTTTGSFYSYGAADSSDRALGGLGSASAYFGSPASGSAAGWIAVAFTNNSGAALGGFTVKFDGEQWRDGGSATPQEMVMGYGFGNRFAPSGWLAEPFKWSSPHNSSSGAIDGNTFATLSAGGTVSAVWNPGETLWISWREFNDPGNDHGLAIDNLSFGVAAVPEPETYAMMLAGLGLVGGVARRRVKQ